MSDKSEPSAIEPESKKCAVCFSSATNACASCKLVFYCSRDHQKQDWATHKPICQRKIKMVSSLELGHHWVAAQDLPVGSVVISELPAFILPRPSYMPGMECCLTCCCIFKTGSGVICNAGCKSLFCSDICASAPLHVNIECEIIRGSLSKAEVTSFVPLAIGRSGMQGQGPPINTNIMMLPFFRGLGLKLKNPGLWAKVMELEKKVSLPPPAEGTLDAILEVWPYFELISSFLENLILDPPIPEEQKEQLCKEINQFQCILSKFSFTNRDKTGIQDAQNNFKLTYWRNFYLQTASISRQCFPNCFVTIGQGPDYRLMIRTQTEVKSGQPLSIPTIDSMTIDFMGAVRTQFLQKEIFTRNDICSCPRCLDPTELGTMLSAVKCTQCKKGYLLPINPTNMDINAPWMCNGGCLGGLVWNEVRQLTDNLSEEGKKFVKNVEVEGVSRIQEYLDRIRGILHPNHWVLLEIEEGLVIKLEQYSHGSGVSAKRSDMHLEMLGHLLEMAKITAPGKSPLRKKYMDLLINQRGQRLNTMKLKNPLTPFTKEFLGENIKLTNECLEINKIHSCGPQNLATLTKSRDQLVFLYNLSNTWNDVMGPN